MRRKFATLSGIAILAVAVIAGVARSDSTSSTTPKHHHHHHMMMGMGALGAPLPMLLKSANLTDDQKAQVKQIFHSNFANMKTQFEAIHTAQQQIATKLWSAGTVNASDLSSQLQAITQAHDQMAQNQLNTIVAIRNILSADQLSAVGQAQDNFEAKRAAWIAAHKNGTPQSSPSDSDAPAAP